MGNVILRGGHIQTAASGYSGDATLGNFYIYVGNGQGTNYTISCPSGNSVIDGTGGICILTNDAASVDNATFNVATVRVPVGLCPHQDLPVH